MTTPNSTIPTIPITSTITTSTTAATETYRCKYGEAPKLTHYNYSEWAPLMENFLHTENAWSIVIGDEERPPVNARIPYQDFLKRSAKATAMLVASCSRSTVPYVRTQRDPYTIWETLKTKCDTVASRAGRNTIVRNFYNCSPIPGEPISTFCTKLLEYQMLLAGTEQAISDEAFLAYFTGKLPDAYRTVVRSLVHQEGQYTVHRVIGAVIEEDRDLQNVSTSANTSITSGSALTATRGGHGRRRGRGYSGRGKGRGGYSGSWVNRESNDRIEKTGRRCFYCGRSGHIRSKCRIRENGEKARSEFGTQKDQFNPGDDSSSVNATTASAHALVSATASISRSDISTADPAWIVDSGASHHICGRHQNFYRLQHLEKPIEIYLGDNTVILAIGIGTIRIVLNNGKTLEIESLYAPKCQKPLLSVNQLARNYRISFWKDKCYIHFKPSSGYMLGYLRNGLYHLNGKEAPKAVALIITRSRSKTTNHGTTPNERSPLLNERGEKPKTRIRRSLVPAKEPPASMQLWH